MGICPELVVLAVHLHPVLAQPNIPVVMAIQRQAAVAVQQDRMASGEMEITAAETTQVVVAAAVPVVERVAVSEQEAVAQAQAATEEIIHPVLALAEAPHFLTLVIMVLPVAVVVAVAPLARTPAKAAMAALE